MLREEIMRPQSSLKSHSLPHYITGFFFLLSSSIFFFFFFGQLEVFQKAFRSGKLQTFETQDFMFLLV